MVLSSPSVTDVQAAGVISGGIKGAVVGGLLGGKRGARIGGVVGAVAGGARQASRNQAYREARARSAYRATAPYRSGVHSNFYAAPPRVIVRPPVISYRQ
jgi:uncharacterized protein YcfJ